MVASSVGLISLCFAASASAGALELTSENFDREVFDSGKNAFIKFLAVRRARPPPYRHRPNPALAEPVPTRDARSLGEATASQ